MSHAAAPSTSGAVDLGECTRRHKRWRCRCSPCRVCHHGKHSAVHGPLDGALPGSEPWGHEYQAMPSTTFL